jgi:hypothetical protein
MINRGSEVSVKRQAELLDVSRASVYYRPLSISVFPVVYFNKNVAEERAVQQIA